MSVARIKKLPLIAIVLLSLSGSNVFAADEKGAEQPLAGQKRNSATVDGSGGVRIRSASGYDYSKGGLPKGARGASITGVTFIESPKAVTPPSAKRANTAINTTVKTSTTVEKNGGKRPDSYWKSKLDPNVYNVTRCSATEPAFTGKYWNNHDPGDYKCSNCGVLLFDSKDKFDSGSGWPSFTKPQGQSVEKKVDRSYGMTRDEVVCKNCGAHLGHVFDDGPKPKGGKRYCINSASLDFKGKKADE